MNNIPPYIPGYSDYDPHRLVDPCRTDNYYGQQEPESETEQSD